MPATACTSIPRRRCSTCARFWRICGPDVEAVDARDAGRRDGDDCRRHSAQPRGAVEHAAAAAAGRARAALRAEGTAAGAGGAGRGRALRLSGTSTRRCAQSQAVMMLRIQAERLAGLQLDLDEYKANYQLTGQRLAAHAPHGGGDASGTDYSRHGDYGGRGRWRAVGDSGAGDERSGDPHGGDGTGAARQPSKEAAHDGAGDSRRAPDRSGGRRGCGQGHSAQGRARGRDCRAGQAEEARMARRCWMRRG